MSENEDQNADDSAVGTSTLETISTKKSKAYSPLRRRLTEKELMNIGSVNLLIDDIERMDSEIDSLKPYRDLHHKLDVENAILKEKLASYKLSELSYNVSISLGALLIGLAKPLWGVEFYGLVALIGGAALWLTGSGMKFGRMFVK